MTSLRCPMSDRVCLYKRWIGWQRRFTWMRCPRNAASAKPRRSKLMSQWILNLLINNDVSCIRLCGRNSVNWKIFLQIAWAMTNGKKVSIKLDEVHIRRNLYLLYFRSFGSRRESTIVNLLGRDRIPWRIYVKLQTQVFRWEMFSRRACDSRAKSFHWTEDSERTIIALTMSARLLKRNRNKFWDFFSLAF